MTHIESELQDELRTTPVEPLLPVEKKLIIWSLSVGLVLLGRAGDGEPLLPGHRLGKRDKKRGRSIPVGSAGLRAALEPVSVRDANL